MDLSSPGSGPRVAGFIVGGVGLALGIAGTVIIMVVPGAVAAEHARLSALPSPDAIVLGDTPAGRDVLLEGRIAPGQPVRFRTYVAFAREEEDRSRAGEERTVWKTVARETPPLALAMEGGTARVVNDSYGIAAVANSWTDHSKIIETRYRGIVAGEAVVVLGRAAPGGVEARIIAPGTRASYLATVASGSAVGWWLGVLFLGVASLLAIVAVILFITAVRIRAASAH